MGCCPGNQRLKKVSLQTLAEPTTTQKSYDESPMLAVVVLYHHLLTMLPHRIVVTVSVVGLSVVVVAGPTVDATPAGSGTRQAKVALVPKVQVRAKQITIESRDLPSGWATDSTWDRSAVAQQGP